MNRSILFLILCTFPVLAFTHPYHGEGLPVPFSQQPMSFFMNDGERKTEEIFISPNSESKILLVISCHSQGPGIDISLPPGHAIFVPQLRTGPRDQDRQGHSIICKGSPSDTRADRAVVFSLHDGEKTDQSISHLDKSSSSPALLHIFCGQWDPIADLVIETGDSFIMPPQPTSTIVGEQEARVVTCE